MKKILPVFTMTCCFLLLTSCALETSSAPKTKQIKEVSLAKGSKTKIGYIEPDSTWKCSQLYRKSETWGMNKMKGMLKFGGAYEILQEQAIDFANQNNLNPNYIYLHVPGETYVNNFNLHPFEEAYIIYYQCKYPPALNNRIF